MRKILISGASRGIGKAIALKLLKEGHSLSLGIRNKEDLINTELDPKINNPESFLVHSYDANDIKTSKKWVEKTVKTFKNIDTVIHLASLASPVYYKKYPLETIDIGTTVTRKLLEKCKEWNATFIFFSSSEIYGNPSSEFGGIFCSRTCSINYTEKIKKLNKKI